MKIVNILLLIFLLAFSGLYSQETPQTYNLQIEGQITNMEDDPMVGAVVQVYQGAKLINTYACDGKGKYAFELPLNNDYMIVVSAPNKVSKKYSVSTRGIPPERAQQKFSPIKADLSLFEKMEGIDYSFLNQPLQKYMFKSEKSNFAYDEIYFQQSLANLQRLREQEEALRNKQKELEANYQAAIKIADKAFQKKEWSTAKANYQKAIDLKSNEPYPKAQLAQIDVIIKDQEALNKKKEEEAKKAAEDAAKKKEEENLNNKYLAALKKGDDAFAKQDWTAARAGYNEALGVKPSEQLPKDKLAAIDKAIADAKAKADAEAKAKAEAEAKKKAEEEARLAKEKADAEAAKKKAAEEAAAKAKAEAEAKAKADAEAAKKKAEEEARLAKEKADAEAKAKAEAEAKKKAEEEAAKKKAEEEARLAKEKADAEAKAKAEAEAKKKAEEEAAKKKAEEEARLAKEKADAEAKAKAEAEAKKKAEEEAEAKKKAEEEAAKKKAAEEAAAKAKADAEAAKKKAEEEARLAKEKADAEAKAKAEAEAKKKAEEEAAKKKAAEEAAAKAKAEADAKAKADSEAAKKKAEEEARLAKEKAEADAKAKADAEAAKKKAEEEADAEAKAKAEAEAKKKADAEAAKKKAEEEARLAKEKADAEAKAKADAEAEAKRKAEEAKKKTLPTLGVDKYKEAITKADGLFKAKRYKDAKPAYEEALIAKAGDTYAKSQLAEIEKLLKSDVATAAELDARQKALRAKYNPGVTEETISGTGVVIIQRVVVKPERVYVYEKKIFNWGGVFYFRDGDKITESTFELETKP